MRIAILGAGNGGKTAAADLTLRGHEVNLFDFAEFGHVLEPIRNAGGIELLGVGRNGFAKLNKVTTDIAEAFDGVEIIMAVVSAMGHEPLARICAPHLKDGQVVVLNPGSTLGSLEFRTVLTQCGSKARVKIADLHTLTYATRGEGATVRMLLEVKKLWFSAFPARDTPAVLEKFRQLYPVAEAGKNILDVGLNNGNPVCHPVPALLNTGRVELARGEYYHYKEGVTPHVAKVVEAVDEERLNLCRAMGYHAMPSLERLYLMGYSTTRTNLCEAYTTSPVFCGEYPIKGPYTVMDRYFVEDTAYGAVTWSSLGKTIGVKTPVIDSVVRLISVLHGVDYFGAGKRSLERFGLAGLSVEGLNRFFENGE